MQVLAGPGGRAGHLPARVPGTTRWGLRRL